LVVTEFASKWLVQLLHLTVGACEYMTCMLMQQYIKMPSETGIKLCDHLQTTAQRRSCLLATSACVLQDMIISAPALPAPLAVIVLQTSAQSPGSTIDSADFLQRSAACML
jgi:hypothetical protein